MLVSKFTIQCVQPAVELLSDHLAPPFPLQPTGKKRLIPHKALRHGLLRYLHSYYNQKG